MPTSVSYELATSLPDVETPVGSTTNIGSGLTDDAGDAANQNTQHCPEALSHLLFQYQGKPRIESLVCAFVDEIQELENALWQLYTQRTLDTAVGVQLDGLGSIVGESRNGRSDSEYRQFIRVRILVNRSNGTPEQLYEILRAALGQSMNAAIREHFPASFTVEISTSLGSLTGSQVALLMRQAKPAGVGLGGVIFGTFIIGSASATVTDAGIIGHNTISVTGADTVGAVFT